MKLFIGKYENEVYFGVLSMDAYHIGMFMEILTLLSGSEKCYRHVQLHRRKNTYTHVKDGVIYMLNSLIDVPTNVTLNKKLVYYLKEFSYKEDGITYGLAIVGKRDEVANDVSKEAQSLLHRFNGLTLDELPYSLPPVYDIQHHIDFIPDAILPNLPHYKMPTSQNAEFQEQVEKLLKKGYYLLGHCSSPLIPKQRMEY